MKQYVVVLYSFLCSFACIHNKATNIVSIESEMINFFRSTLQRNYGSSDGKAVKLIMDALLHYKFH